MVRATRYTGGTGSGGPPPPPATSNLTYPDVAHLRDAAVLVATSPDVVLLRDAPTLQTRMPDAAHLRDGYAVALAEVKGDAVHLRDGLAVGSSQPESLHVRDALTFAPLLPESLHVRDALTMGSSRTETLHARDAGAYNLTSLVVGRSGTPDADQMSDGWVDQASTGTNHGNESLQCKGASTAPGSDAKIAFLQLDLTRLTGCHAGAAGATLTVRASTSNGVVATTVTFGWAVQATKWFTESSMTWATGRPIPAQTFSTFSVATGAVATYTVTFTQAQLNTMIGNWVIFEFQTAGAAAPDTVTVLSRDDATASNRPAFTASLIIP